MDNSLSRLKERERENKTRNERVDATANITETAVKNYTVTN